MGDGLGIFAALKVNMPNKTTGVVCAGHTETAEAAVTILQEGGNTFDAAVAALFASFVCEPCMSSPGGGGFMTAVEEHKKSFVFDFFCQTPSAKRPISEIEFYPIDLNFGTRTEEFHIGIGACGVPGSIAGLFAIYDNLCTLPLKVLAEPALQLAKNVVVVDDFQFIDYELLAPIIEKAEEARPIFFPGGKLIQEGEVLRFHHLADTIDYLVHEGQDAFYKGEIARRVVKDSERLGGLLIMQDFAQYQVEVRKPIKFDYRDKTIITNPPPSLGGKLIQLFMSLLENDNHPLGKPYNIDHVSRLQQVFDKVDKTNCSLPKIEKELSDLTESNNEMNNPIKKGGTSHFSILDEMGNAVSISTSNGEGSGYMPQGTDIMFNNMLGESALMPGGFHSWPTNTRVTSLMAPLIALNSKGIIEIVTGSGGASRIPGAISQVLHYLLDHKMHVEEAVNAPRIHWEDGVLNVEPGFEGRLNHPSNMKQLYMWDKKGVFFGGVHTIVNHEGKIEASGDARRSGVVRYSL